jgi:hypothetical protein
MARRIPKKTAWTPQQRVKQFQTWLVCQFCGRTTSVDEAEGWLNQPHRHERGLRIVRCPQHISEWALRHTEEGRTLANRELAEKGRMMPVPIIPPYASPFPLTEQPRKEDDHGKQTTATP